MQFHKLTCSPHSKVSNLPLGFEACDLLIQAQDCGTSKSMVYFTSYGHFTYQECWRTVSGMVHLIRLFSYRVSPEGHCRFLVTEAKSLSWVFFLGCSSFFTEPLLNTGDHMNCGEFGLTERTRTPLQIMSHKIMSKCTFTPGRITYITHQSTKHSVGTGPRVTRHNQFMPHLQTMQSSEIITWFHQKLIRRTLLHGDQYQSVG